MVHKENGKLSILSIAKSRKKYYSIKQRGVIYEKQ